MIWPWGDAEEAGAAALTQSYGAFQRAASRPPPSDRVQGRLRDGFDSTPRRMHTRFPGARLGPCRRHALLKRPTPRAAMASPVRQAVRSPCHPLLSRARQRQGLRVVALGHRVRRVAAHVTPTAGPTNGPRVRRGGQDTQAGWEAVLAAPQMPVTSTLLDQAPHAIARQLFARPGLHHPGGHHQALRTGRAHRSNVVSYQRRAMQAGQGGVDVAGGPVPTADGCLNLPLLTAGGFR